MNAIPAPPRQEGGRSVDARFEDGRVEVGIFDGEDWVESIAFPDLAAAHQFHDALKVALAEAGRGPPIRKVERVFDEDAIASLLRAERLAREAAGILRAEGAMHSYRYLQRALKSIEGARRHAIGRCARQSVQRPERCAWPTEHGPDCRCLEPR